MKLCAWQNPPCQEGGEMRSALALHMLIKVEITPVRWATIDGA